jgi:hypothetical protein
MNEQDEKAERWAREIAEWQASLNADMVAKTQAIASKMPDFVGRSDSIDSDVQEEVRKRLKVQKMEYEAVFPLASNAWKSVFEADWNTSNVPKNTFEKVALFRVNGHLIPDWMHGFTAIDHDASLPEAGSDEEIKAGIFGVMEDCLARKARVVRDTLENYDIMAVEFKGDFLTRTLHVLAVTNRQVMSVNTVLTNKKVRTAMTGRVVLSVHTNVEPHRRTDDYLHPQPARQHLVRTFVYCDRVLVRNEPESWSAGTSYANGDIVSAAGIRWRVGDDPLDTVPGFLVGRNGAKARSALGTRERAYAQAARNR